jgi:hypothetical protein
MTCELEKQLRKSKLDAELKFKSVSLPVAVEPLGLESPPGHNLSSESRKEINAAREEYRKAKDTHQSHIMSCLNCKCS